MGYSYDEYLKAVELLSKGLGLAEVCRLMNWPETRRSTLWYWKHNIFKPPTSRWVPKPSRELAYVIGVLYGDGNLERHQYKYDIKLNTVDYEFAEEFSKALSKLLNKRYRRPRWIGIQRGRNYGWKVAYSSKAFYTWFKQQTLETLKQYIENNKETVKHFLRGLYDSEGNNYRCKVITLHNSDLKLLQYVRSLLAKYFNINTLEPYLVVKAGSIMEIRGEVYVRRRNVYILKINRRRDVQIFLSKIGFSIKEKQYGLPRRKQTNSSSNAI